MLPIAKPNQQLVNELRDRATAGDVDAALRAAREFGARIREALGSLPVPLLAVQTHFSLLHGTASPQLWGEALAGLHRQPLPGGRDRRGGNHPSDAAAVHAAARALALARAADHDQAAGVREPPAPATDGPWAALADHDDLLGLPAALDAWGRGHLAVGATLACAGGDVVLLAPDEAAYARLCRLLSWRHEDAPAWRRWQAGERVAHADCGGLIALVRDAGDARRWRDAGAEAWWRCGLRPQPGPADLPAACAPLVAHLAGDRGLAPLLAAIRTQGTVAGGGGDGAAHAGNGVAHAGNGVAHAGNGVAHAGNGVALADLAQLPAAYRGYEDLIERGAALLDRCRYAPGARDAAGQPVLHLPPLPPGLEGVDPDRELRRLAEAGLRRRYAVHDRQAATVRLEHELAVIRDKRFASYILTVWDIARGHRTCGRGSAASSIVCYCLGITNVDPLRWNLMFERFLAPERLDPPDIDVDFAWDERDALLAEVIARFGREHVGMVATHQQLQRRGALREVARARGLPDAAITAMAQRLGDAAEYGMQRDGGDAAILPPWPEVLRAAAALVGAPRHVGLHCGGMVITARPIRDLVPVHPAAKTLDADDEAHGATAFHVPAIAWEKDGAEDLGLVKIDLLGNRSLAVVRDCLADLSEDGCAPGPDWDPMHDEATRAAMASGATLGCFYIESPAMRQLQAKIGSPEFDRLVVHSSIIRPAGNAFINAYIARYHRSRELAENGETVSGDEKREWYPHPCLEDLLSESFGVLSYQEDVMQVAQAMAGFGSAEANQLRKALGRTDTAERLKTLAGRFDSGCRANGVAQHVIDLVWRMISSFAGYSFCKAHSASYAAVSFECAWLKVHHPGCFMARVIANQGGYYQPGAYLEEARRLGVEIRGPCVLASRWKAQREGRCRDLQPGALRLGLQSVPGLSAATAAAIERERPFRGLRDCRRRTGARADELEQLLAVGALDALTPGLDAAQRAWLVALVGRVRDAPPAARAGQTVLDLAPADLPDPQPPSLPRLPRDQVLRRRFAALGMLAEQHPLTLWRLPRRGPLRCRDLTAERKGQRVTLIAWPITRKDVAATYLTDGRGEPLPEPRFESMCFVTVEDETGLVETVWFPEAYRRHGVLLQRHEPLRLSGVVEVAHGHATLHVQRAEAC